MIIFSTLKSSNTIFFQLWTQDLSDNALDSSKKIAHMHAYTYKRLLNQ